MPTLDIGESIKEWTSTRLVRFIKDLFERDPPGFIGSTSIDNLSVVNTLIVQDQIQFTRDPNFHFIGNPGEPAFANSWVNWGAPYFPAGYWKDPFGWVHLCGVIKTGTVGSSAFTLPAGARPSSAILLATISNSAIGRVDIDTAGNVIPASPSNNAWVTLDNLRFKTR